MTQKKKLYSLLAILLSVTLLVTGIICALIFWLAQQSTQNFENFIVESRQQEINSAVRSFSDGRGYAASAHADGAERQRPDTAAAVL